MNRPQSTGRIRVLRLIARMNVGGPALQIATLVRGLDANLIDHRVLVGSVEEGEVDYLLLRAPDVEVVRVPGLGRSVRAAGDIRALRFVRAQIKEFRPHIVHTHTAKAGVLGRVASLQKPRPATVHTFHGHLLHGYFNPPVTAAVRSVERALARRTDRLVAVGGKVRDDLLAAGIGRPDQYVVVPPGVNLPPPPSRRDARRMLGIDEDALVVAFVARLTDVKRPERAVEIVARILPRHPSLVLAVAGEGPGLEALRLRATPLGINVRFLGWRADVETVYAAADAALLTSDNEGMPVSLIEAAWCGVPAVTTNVGSASEVVVDGETGFVVKPEVVGLAAALERLLGDVELRVRMGQAARRHAEEQFSARRLVADTEALYLDLAGVSR